MADLEFFVPADVDLFKSESGEQVRRIRGFASNTNRDRQDESIVQKGLDISDFLNYGWFNYDHDNTKILGYPDKEKTTIVSGGFYVEGTLLKGVPLADHVWEVAVALKKSGAPRKLGFSVEGKVLKRDDDGTILKAKIYNVAITPNPVNPTATWDAIVKSFGDGQGSPVSGQEAITSAGYKHTIGEPDNGACLKTESLESALKNLSYLLEDNETAKKKLKELRETLDAKSISKSELMLFLQLSKGLSRSQAQEIVYKFNI